ncbi:MAG TPA: lytic transglycosylase, partial [Roseiarcus sp.]
MRLRTWKSILFSIAAAATVGVATARAADCGDSADGFNEWLTSFKQVAIRNGLSQQVVDSSLNGVVFDSSVA